MRLFRRVGSRSSDASDTPASQDPQLTALRFDTQTPLFNDSVENNILKDENYKSAPRSEEDHIKQLQQIFRPPTSPNFSTNVARSMTSSPRISAMPKSKVAGGKKQILSNNILFALINGYRPRNSKLNEHIIC